jgi:hypothetical protein
MRLISILLLVLLSGGVMAASDNLNGKKFEQLEQMIKDLEGQMTALTIENALLNDAVSDLERDLGDAEFEITQLENTVAILSAGGGGGQEVEYEFVGFVTTETCDNYGPNCLLDWVVSICESKFGSGARVTSLSEYAREKFDLGIFSSTVFVNGNWEMFGHSTQTVFVAVNGSSVFSYRDSIGRSTNIRLPCSAPI